MEEREKIGILSEWCKECGGFINLGVCEKCGEEADNG